MSSSDADLHEIASRIVEQLASKQTYLSDSARQDDNSASDAVDSLQAQYLLLRITLVSALRRLPRLD